jgi:tripartite-type tricarboxylate transporter receptor subunit TctC
MNCANILRLRRSTAMLLATAVLASAAAHGQPHNSVGFPSRPITIIVPYTPSSGGDIAARAVGPFIARKLGQPVVIYNRPGASGTIGTAQAAHALPDGYTLLMSAETLTMVPSLYKRLTFSPTRDFAPIGRTATGTLALLVNSTIPATSVSEFVALVKHRPGKYSYASPGLGTPQHVFMELFEQSTGVNLLHVPYKGVAGALTDLVGGQIDAAFLSPQVAAPHVASGKLRMLAIADTTRAATMPDVPIFREVGMPELSNPTWVGLFAPAGTPAQAVERIHAALSEALQDAEVRATMQRQGLRVSPSSPEELAREVQNGIVRWQKVITTAGITAD